MSRWKIDPATGKWKDTYLEPEYKSPNAGKVFKAPTPEETAGQKLEKSGEYLKNPETEVDTSQPLESKKMDEIYAKDKAENLGKDKAIKASDKAWKKGNLTDRERIEQLLQAPKEVDQDTITPTQPMSLKQTIGTLSNRQYRSDLINSGEAVFNNPLDLMDAAIGTGLDKVVGVHDERMKIVEPATNINPLLGLAADLVTPSASDLLFGAGTINRAIQKTKKVDWKIANALLDDVFSEANSLFKRTFRKNQLIYETGGNVQNNTVFKAVGSGGGGGGRIKQTELKIEPFMSNTYQRNTLTKMKEFGMGDGTFRMKTYDANKARFAKTNKPREMLESYLSPDRLKGSFEGYKDFNKGTWEYNWGDFLKAKGYDLKQGIQAHHINPLFDSIHLFDNVKFNSKEYWSLMDILIKKNARTGAIQKGDEINNLMMTLGQATDKATPHGIAHKFYNNFTPDFFSKSEMKKINKVPGYRKKKAERWATLVNKSEEIILEAHKQWSALNPKIDMSFDELIEQMSNYSNLGYNKLIDPKYQLPDIHNIVTEIVTTGPKRGRKPKIQNTLKRLLPDVDPKTGNVQRNLFDINE